MHGRERLYELTLRAGRGLLRRGWGHEGLGRALDGRAAALPALRAWAGKARSAAPLVLVHAPSVGEALMAQAIIGELRSTRPDVQVAFTFFSPSAERVAQRVGADIASYLPWDVAADSGELLDTLRPAAIAFIRTEIWPVLGALAAQRGTRTLLLNAVLASGSSRLRAGARLLLGPAYRRLDAIGAVAPADAARFQLLGVDRARMHVTGDARFDQVWSRIQQLDRDSPLLRRLQSERVTLVAGSTWPADEAMLAAALATVPVELRPRLILAPHQPTPEHLEGAERTFAGLGLRAQRLAAFEQQGGSPDLVLVDRVGVLADLYAIADLAYVGGGFGSAGLHSVVEPAALGVPVLYGPRHGNAREAGELAEAGGGRIVTSADAGEALRRWLDRSADRRAAGEAARAFVQARLGGAAGNAALILAGLPPA